MKIQIDTTNKIIRVEENVNLGELCKVLDKLLPKEWKSFTLETNSFITWVNPIPWIYRDPWVIPYNPYPVTYSTGNPPLENPVTICKTGIYNIECQIN
jgi:hypothetical protein